MTPELVVLEQLTEVEFEHASRPASNTGASAQTDRPSTAMEQDPEGCTVVKMLFARYAASTGWRVTS
jgi:hypothetical protein